MYYKSELLFIWGDMVSNFLLHYIFLYVPQHVGGGQRTCRSQFSLSATQVLGAQVPLSAEPFPSPSYLDFETVSDYVFQAGLELKLEVFSWFQLPKCYAHRLVISHLLTTYYINNFSKLILSEMTSLIQPSSKDKSGQDIRMQEENLSKEFQSLLGKIHS